jgi:hypothetical protein
MNCDSENDITSLFPVSDFEDNNKIEIPFLFLNMLYIVMLENMKERVMMNLIIENSVL